MTIASNLQRPISLFTTGFLFALLGPGCRQVMPSGEESHPPASVKAETASTKFIGEWTDLFGSTQAVPGKLARITAPVDGRVVLVLPDAGGKPLAEGQTVKAGDVVVQLDSRLVEQQRRQAENAVKQTDIEVKRLRELSRGSSSTGSEPLVSQIQLEKALIDHDDALSKRQALEEQLKFYTLSAPIAGKIGLIQVVPGQTIAAGAAITEVVDLTEIDALCFVPPRVAARLAVGQQARIDEGQEDAASPKGKVVFLAVQGQADTGNFAVKVRFDNKDQKLRANTVVRVQVLTEPEKERWVVPESAVMEDQEPPTVVVVQDVKTVNPKGEVVKEEKKARKFKVVVGVRYRPWHVVEVIGLEPLPSEEPSGAEGAAKEGSEAVPALKEVTEPATVENALYVTEGGHGLQDGDLVKIEEGEEETK